MAIQVNVGKLEDVPEIMRENISFFAGENCFLRENARFCLFLIENYCFFFISDWKRSEDKAIL